MQGWLSVNVLDGYLNKINGMKKNPLQLKFDFQKKNWIKKVKATDYEQQIILGNFLFNSSIDGKIKVLALEKIYFCDILINTLITQANSLIVLDENIRQKNDKMVNDITDRIKSLFENKCSERDIVTHLMSVKNNSKAKIQDINSPFFEIFGIGASMVKDSKMLYSLLSNDNQVASNMMNFTFSAYNNIIVNNISDNITLSAIISSNNYSFNIKVLALNKIDDNELLVQLEKNVADLEVKKIIQNKLNTDITQDVLLHLAKEANNIGEERIEAIRNIKDKKVLKQILSSEKNYSIRKILFEELNISNSPDALKDIALNETNIKERIKAIENITDENFLCDLMKNEDDTILLDIAIQNIKRPQLLLELALDKKNKNVIQTAISRINDNELLGKICLMGTEYNLLSNEIIEILKTGIEKIDDEKVLFEIIMKGSKFTKVSEMAMDKIKDQSILCDLAVNGINVSVAINKIQKPDLLAKIVKTNYPLNLDSSYNILALDKINEQRYFLDIATHPDCIKIKELAISKISDKDILKEMLQDKSDYNIRKHAYFKLGIQDERDVLKDIIHNDSDKTILNQALGKIVSDNKALIEVVLNEDNISAKIAAIENINETKTLIDLSNNTELDLKFRVIAAIKCKKGTETLISDLISKLSDPNNPVINYLYDLRELYHVVEMTNQSKEKIEDLDGKTFRTMSSDDYHEARMRDVDCTDKVKFILNDC